MCNSLILRAWHGGWELDMLHVALLAPLPPLGCRAVRKYDWWLGIACQWLVLVLVCCCCRLKAPSGSWALPASARACHTVAFGTRTTL